MNDAYFNGTLITPTFRVTHTIDVAGQYRRTGLSCEIRMSDVYDLDDRSYKNTMLHEMIHLKLDQFNIKDNGDHGKKFMNEAARINAFGWNVTPKSDASSYEINRNVLKKRTVYLFGLRDFVMAVASERGSEHILESVIRKKGARYIKRIFTDDPMFAFLPLCRTRAVGIKLDKTQIDYVIETFGFIAL